MQGGDCCVDWWLVVLLNDYVPLSCPGSVRVQEEDCRQVSGCFIK